MLHPHDIYSTKEPWTIRIIEIARQFITKGHHVKLIYFPLPKKERGLKSEKITEFETIPFSRRNYHLIKNILKFRKYAKWADVIHFQKCFPNAVLPALIWAFLYNKPIHYDWDDWEYEIYNYEPPSKLFGFYINTMEKTLLKVVDTLSVASYKLKEIAIKRGFRKNRIFMAHVGADLDRFSPKINGDKIKKKYNLKKNVVLYLGQLHGAQYAGLAIKAFPKILKEKKDVSLFIVGGGFYLDELKKLVKEMNLSNDIIFTGYVKREDIPKHIATADVAIASFEKNKITECKSPLKIVEYLASGKPIVASDVGEVKRMVGDAGILVEPGNSEKIADAVLEILKNKKLKKTLEIKARKQAEKKFTWEITANNLLKAYNLSLKRNL